MQLKALLCLLALCLASTVEAHGYYYGSHRRLSEAAGLGGRHLSSYYYGGSSRKLFSYGYYGGSQRRLQEFSVRPLFGNAFMSAQGAADIPVPQFLTRHLQGAGRQLSSYYYGGSHRRLQTVGGRALNSYGYYGHH
ncbi:hypothetical protein ABPG75_001185 [Micractinium tetrahymenae]